MIPSLPSFSSEWINPLDTAMLVLFAASIIFGYRRGFVLQFVSLLSLFVAWLAAYLFYDDVSPVLGKLVATEVFARYPNYAYVAQGLSLDTYILNAISFVAVFTVVKLGLGLAGHMLNLIAKVPGLNALNRWTGAALALVEAAAMAIVLIYFMTLLPVDGVQELLERSRWADNFLSFVPYMLGKMNAA